MKSLVLIITFSLISISSFAAECKFLPKSSVKKIYSILNQHQAFEDIAVVDSYCKECMDDYVTPIVIDKVEIKKHTINGFFTLNINNEPIELNHTYLNGENLGYKAGCESKFATKFLYQTNTRKTSAKI